MRGAIFFFLVLSISLVGCSGASGGEDAGSDGGRVEMDAGRDAGRADAGPRDAGAVDAGSDAGEASDAGTDAGEAIDAGTDAGEASDAGSDAGVIDAGAADAGRDAGRDAGSVPPGECDTTSPLCSTFCLVAVNCVRACGGPVTSCGCCPCAPGSMNAFECSGASE